MKCWIYSVVRSVLLSVHIMQRQFVSHSWVDFPENANRVALWCYQNIAVFAWACRPTRYTLEPIYLFDQWHVEAIWIIVWHLCYISGTEIMHDKWCHDCLCVLQMHEIVRSVRYVVCVGSKLISRGTLRHDALHPVTPVVIWRKRRYQTSSLHVFRLANSDQAKQVWARLVTR